MSNDQTRVCVQYIKVLMVNLHKKVFVVREKAPGCSLPSLLVNLLETYFFVLLKHWFIFLNFFQVRCNVGQICYIFLCSFNSGTFAVIS